MVMGEHERRLLMTGTLDTSGVGNSPYAWLPNVAVAFGAESEVPVGGEAAAEPELAEPKLAENTPSVADEVPEEPVVKAAPRKRTVKKSQTSSSAGRR